MAIPNSHELIINCQSTNHSWRKTLRLLSESEPQKKVSHLITDDDQREALARAGHPSTPSVVCTSVTGHLLISSSLSPSYIVLSSLGDAPQHIALKPAASTADLRGAVFHPERKDCFAIIFEDDTIAAYDGSLLLAGRSGEISAIKALSGVMSAAFIPGSMSKLLTVGSNGQSYVIQFEAAEKRRAQVVGSWQIDESCTSVAILNVKAIENAKAAAAKREGKTTAGPSLKKASAAVRKSPWIAAVGRTDGKVLLYDSSMNQLEETTVGDEPITGLHWTPREPVAQTEQCQTARAEKHVGSFPVNRRRSLAKGKRKSLGKMLVPGRRTGENKQPSQTKTPQVQMTQLPAMSSVEAKIMELQSQLQQLKDNQTLPTTVSGQTEQGRTDAVGEAGVSKKQADGWEDLSSIPAQLPPNNSDILSSIRSVNAMGRGSVKKGFALFAPYMPQLKAVETTGNEPIEQATAERTTAQAEVENQPLSADVSKPTSGDKIQARKSTSSIRMSAQKARKSVVFREEDVAEEEGKEHVLLPKSPHPRSTIQVLADKPTRSRLISPGRRRQALTEIENPTSPNKILSGQNPKPASKPAKKPATDFRASTSTTSNPARPPLTSRSTSSTSSAPNPAAPPGPSGSSTATGLSQHFEAALASMRTDQQAFRTEMEREMRDQRRVFEAALGRRDGEEARLRQENGTLKGQLAALVEEVERARMLGLGVGGGG